MRIEDIPFIILLCTLTAIGSSALYQNKELRAENAACIASIDSITATREVKVLELDSMIARHKREYVEP